jgi:hypothetical protein
MLIKVERYVYKKIMLNGMLCKNQPLIRVMVAGVKELLATDNENGRKNAIEYAHTRKREVLRAFSNEKINIVVNL